MKTLKKNLFEGCEMKTADMTSIKGGKKVVDSCSTGDNNCVADAGCGWSDTLLVYDDESFETVVFK